MPKHPEFLQEIEDSTHSELVLRLLNEVSANGKLKHAIGKALEDYARGRDIHEIMKELKEVERDYARAD